jgi:hypothetical protein
VSEKSWLMDAKLNYFRVSYFLDDSEEKIILAVKHIQIMARWMEAIEIAKSYVTNEKYVSRIEPEMQLIELLDDVKNEVKVHKRQVDAKKQESPSKKKYSIIDMKVS